MPLVTPPLAATEYFNVLNYGAVRSSVADSSAAFTAAATAAAAVGGTVFIPWGDFKVSQLAAPSGVRWIGSSTNTASLGTRLIGTAGEDIFIINPSAGGIAFEHMTLRQGRRQIATYSLCSLMHIIDINFDGASNAGFYLEGSMESVYFDRCRFATGATSYGVLAANVLNGNGNNYMDETHFTNCLVSGGINTMKFELELSFMVSFDNCSFSSAQQHTMYIDTGGRAWQFVNCNTEGAGQSGKNARTTGTMSSGSATLTVASATGFTIGDDIVVQRAGSTGQDLFTTISNIAGTTFTLAATNISGATVTSVAVTNAIYDDFFFNNTVNGSMQQVNFFGGIIGGEGSGGHLRYSIYNHTNDLGLYGVSTGVGASAPPVYDTNMTSHGMGGTLTIRRPLTLNSTAHSQKQAHFPGMGTNVQDPGATIPSSAGGYIVNALRDSTDNGSGTYGSWQVRKTDATRTKVADIDATGNALLAGSIGVGSITAGTARTISSGTGTPEGVVTAPVGSVFLRTDGGAGTTMYIKESGAGNTGWAPPATGASGGTPALTLGTANAAGTSGTFVRDDDTILAFDATAPVTQAFSDAAAVGSATVAARRDHKHGMPANPGAGGSSTWITAHRWGL